MGHHDTTTCPLGHTDGAPSDHDPIRATLLLTGSAGSCRTETKEGRVPCSRGQSMQRMGFLAGEWEAPLLLSAVVAFWPRFSSCRLRPFAPGSRGVAHMYVCSRILCMPPRAAASWPNPHPPISKIADPCSWPGSRALAASGLLGAGRGWDLWNLMHVQSSGRRYQVLYFSSWMRG